MPPPAVLILGGQGYVGSALVASLLAASLPIESVDLGLRGDPGVAPGRRMPYQELTAEELARFDVVVLLAGHSSVASCDLAPAESFANNVAGFAGLVHKLRGQKLIYASSISIYVNTGGRAAAEPDPLPEAVSYYDFHKQAIERYAALAYPNSYGLRFGTVCGPSPNMRPELLLNCLVRSALREGVVRLANRHAHRPLLGINDLTRAVHAVITGAVAPGRYNLASVNVRIGDVADHVARRFGVPCVEAELPNNYDVRVDTRGFTAASGVEFRDDVAGLTEALHAYYSSATKPGSPSDGP